MPDNPCVSDRRPLYGPQDQHRQEELERLADTLLGGSLRAAPVGEYPFHRERSLQRGVDRSPLSLEVAAPLPPLALRGALLRLVTRLELPQRHRLVFRLAMRGWPQRRIARLLGVHPAQVSRRLRATLERLAAATQGENFPVLRAEQIRYVLRQETGRRAYHPERHCPPGQEACRRTGRCCRRWYLHFED